MLKPLKASFIRSRYLHTAAALFLAVAVAACGEEECEECGVFEPPDTDNPGTMQGYVTDDPDAQEPGYTGAVRGRADLEISTNQRTWYILGDPQNFEVDLASNGRVALTTSGNLPADSYRFVRINFADVEATVEAGSVVDGETLASDVELSLGDTRNAIISADAGVYELEEGGTGSIVLDLNSEVWMTSETLDRGEIRKEVFEHAASVAIVPGS